MAHPVKSFRAAKEMTLEDFGALVGVQKSAVSKWERGVRPSIRAAKVIEEKTGGAIRKEQLRPDIWGATQ